MKGAWAYGAQADVCLICMLYDYVEDKLYVQSN